MNKSGEQPAYVLEGTLVGVLILGPAICIGVAMDARWGSIADWVAALATVAAFFAAIAAARFAAGALRIEQRRETDRLDSELKRQASLVSAWIEFEYREEAADNSASACGLKCMLRNASAVPVHDVKVIGLLDKRGGGPRGREWIQRDLEISTLPPTDQPIVRELVGPDESGWLSTADEATGTARVAPRCTLEFTDSSGRRWVRWPNGQLEEDSDYDSFRAGGA